MRADAHPPRLHTFLLVGMIALSAAGFAAAWVVLGLVMRSPALWMMPLATIDMILLLVLFAEPRGRRRALLAMSGTTLAIGLGLWLLNAVQFGRMFGLAPLAAIDRLGPRLAWELVRASTGAGGGALAAASIVAAGLWGRHARLNARRRSP